MFNTKHGVFAESIGINTDEDEIERLVRKLGEETGIYELRRSHEHLVRQKLTEPDVSAGLHALAAGDGGVTVFVLRRYTQLYRARTLPMKFRCVCSFTPTLVNKTVALPLS